MVRSKRNRRGCLVRGLHAETLERRALLSVSLVGSELRILGGNLADTGEVWTATDGIHARLRNSTGTEEKVYSALQVASLLFEGYGGNDTFENRTGLRSVINGGGGNDILRGGTGNDSIAGANGNDSLFGGGGNDVLNGGSGNDILVGGAGDDVLNGGAHNDTYRFDTDSNLGIDRLYESRNAGADTLDFAETTGRSIVVNLGCYREQLVNPNLRLTLFPDGSTPTLENVVGGSLSDTLTGNSLPNSLNGRGGNDVLYGGNGSDVINGEDGDDLIYGEWDSDQLSGGNGADTVYGGNGIDYVYGGAGNDVLYGYDPREMVLDASADQMWGGAGDDTLYGGGGGDLLDGGDNNDTLFGELGNDTLYGGNHDDHLSGGPGTDTLFGGSGNDGLFGGCEGVADNLWGQAGDDRFLVRFSDRMKDRLSNDAQIELWGPASNDWLDLHVATVDQAFAELQERAGSTAILKDECMGDPLIFVMQNADVDYAGMNYVGWSLAEGYYRRIYLKRWDTTNAGHNEFMKSTVIHEIAHNFDHDDYFLGGDEDNPLWNVFESLHNQSTVEEDYVDRPVWGPDYGFEGVIPYGMTSAKEDWATCWEEYFGYIDTYRATPLLQQKLAIVDQFFRDVI